MSGAESTTRSRVLRIAAGVEDQGKRLDQFLTERLPDRSRGFWRRIIDLGGVHGAGRRLRKNGQIVHAGTAFEIFLDGREDDVYQVESEQVLYQDPYLVVLNKPAGVETQPTPARYRGTLYAALLDHLGRAGGGGQKAELGMLQRLDRDTSGVILFSIHPRAHRHLTQQFCDHSVEKTYLALVAGGPADATGQYRSSLARERRSNRMKSVPAGGREAVTCYRVLERFEGCSLLELQIPTGRTHQIRIHCAEAGHPLLGDRTYGGPSQWDGREVTRQMLHAHRLVVRHPVNGEPLRIEAPLPPDMTALLNRLRPSGDNPA